MRLWSISLSYLDKQGLCGLWREALLAQATLLKGEYIECSKCGGRGFIKNNSWTTGQNETPLIPIKIDCPKCKGMGKIKTPYYNHPQLIRFKQNKDLSLYWITAYLYYTYDEGIKRGYKFDKSKIRLARNSIVTIPVTKGQLKYEFKHLQSKLWLRDRHKYFENKKLIKIFCINETRRRIKAHPIFKIIDNPNREYWEKGKE